MGHRSWVRSGCAQPKSSLSGRGWAWPFSPPQTSAKSLNLDFQSFDNPPKRQTPLLHTRSRIKIKYITRARAFKVDSPLLHQYIKKMMIETKKNEKSRLFFFFFYIFSLFFYRGCGGNFLFSFAKNALSLVVLLVKRLVVYLVVFDFAIFGNHSIYWASRCVVTWSLTWSFTWSLSWSVVGRLLGRFEKWCLRKRLYLLGFSLGRLLVACLVVFLVGILFKHRNKFLGHVIVNVTIAGESLGAFGVS